MLNLLDSSMNIFLHEDELVAFFEFYGEDACTIYVCGSRNLYASVL